MFCLLVLEDFGIEINFTKLIITIEPRTNLANRIYDCKETSGRQKGAIKGVRIDVDGVETFGQSKIKRTKTKKQTVKKSVIIGSPDISFPRSEISSYLVLVYFQHKINAIISHTYAYPWQQWVHLLFIF